MGYRFGEVEGGSNRHFRSVFPFEEITPWAAKMRRRQVCKYPGKHAPRRKRTPNMKALRQRRPGTLEGKTTYQCVCSEVKRWRKAGDEIRWPDHDEFRRAG